MTNQNPSDTVIIEASVLAELISLVKSQQETTDRLLTLLDDSYVGEVSPETYKPKRKGIVQLDRKAENERLAIHRKEEEATEAAKEIGTPSTKWIDGVEKWFRADGKEMTPEEIYTWENSNLIRQTEEAIANGIPLAPALIEMARKEIQSAYDTATKR